MAFDPAKVAIRDCIIPDIGMMMDYWFRSPPGFIEAMGVDPAKLPPESEMAAGHRAKITSNKVLPESKLNAVTITYEGSPIGIHTLNPVTEGDFGIFHAHIMDPVFRGQGIGRRSYPLAVRFFMERFNLQRILFKTPKQNTASIRVKELLGIREIGEEAIGYGLVKEGTIARVFELRKDELERLPK